MSFQSQPGNQQTHTDIEVNADFGNLPTLPTNWRNIDQQRPRGLNWPIWLHVTQNIIEVQWWRWFTLIQQWATTVLEPFANLATEFWHPNQSNPPRRFRLHLWYSCLILLYRPSKYLGYLESFFDADYPPAMIRSCSPPVIRNFFDEQALYQRNTSGAEPSSSARFSTAPIMGNEGARDRVERWNAQVVNRIANDWKRYSHLNIGILAGSVAAMQMQFISQNDLLMGNLFLIVGFSGLGCFSGWNRTLLENMKNMRAIKRWEPLLLSPFDPAVIGNEFECLALPEIYAVKALSLTFLLVFQAPFTYYGFQVKLSDHFKLAFIIIWCIVLVWGTVSIICGARRIKAYSIKSRGA